MQNDILKWLENQTIFLSPPNYIIQQNASLNPEKYRFYNLQQIGEDFVVDYEILDKFMWVRFKKYNTGWRFVSSCVASDDEIVNTTNNTAVLTYLAKCLFDCKLFDDSKVFCINFDNTFVPDKSVQKPFLNWINTIKNKENVFMSFHDSETPKYIFSNDEGILDEYYSDYERKNYIN